MVRSSNGHKQDLEQEWFEFVDKVSNKVLRHFGDHLLDHLSGANFFNIFQSLGSAGALYSLIAPYFLSFSLFTKDRQLVNKIYAQFPQVVAGDRRQAHQVHVAHFTDIFYEVDGVALTLRQQVQTAMKNGKKLTVITCDAENHASLPGVQNFLPIGVYTLPV